MGHNNHPQPQTTLYTTVHRAYIKDFDGTPATQFLFSIHDRDWIAWYYFWEMSADIDTASTSEAWSNSTSSRFGKRVESLQYRPLIPRRCDEFASKRENVGKVWRGALIAKGFLTTEVSLGRVHMKLSVAPYQDINRFEFVPLELKRIGGADRPAERESGNVKHFLLERNTPDNFAKTKRFRSAIN